MGITGAIHHGKTSLAKSFLRQIPSSEYTESSILIGEVANRLNKNFPLSKPTSHNIPAINAWLSDLPDILKQVAHYSRDIIAPRLTSKGMPNENADFEKLFEYLGIVEKDHSIITVPVTPETKERFRPLLQWLGSYVTKNIDPNLWYNELVRQAREAKDSGYDLFVIGGVRFPSDAQVIHEAGGKIIAIERPGLEIKDQTDPTEAYRSLVPADTTVINDGLVGALDHIVTQIWSDLKEDGQLKNRYQASRSGFNAARGPNIESRGIL